MFFRKDTSTKNLLEIFSFVDYKKKKKEKRKIDDNIK